MPRDDLIQVRRGTAAEWASADPVLAEGEPGWDTTNGVFKIGDGATAWSALTAPGSGAYEPLADEITIYAEGLKENNGTKGAIASAPQLRTVTLIDAGNSDASALLRVPSHWAQVTLTAIVMNPTSTGGDIRIRMQSAQWEAGDVPPGLTSTSTVTKAVGATQYQWQALTDASWIIAVDPSKTLYVGVQRQGGLAADTLDGTALHVVALVLTESS